ncbi:MAG: hypothetical protein WBD28_01060 [Candidatus Zixiibacteriota bacterium]
MIKKIIPHCKILEKTCEGGTYPFEKEQKQQVRVMIGKIMSHYKILEK